MSKSNIQSLMKNIKTKASKHSPEILTGLGIAGMISTTVLAVKATPKALQLIEEEKKEQDKDELTALETVKTCWKPYIPAVVTGIFSTACLIGSNSVNAKRNAALATAYAISETALSEYKEKVIETIGEQKEKAVREKIHKDKVDKKPVTKSEVIITEKGNTLCLDLLSGRYFKSDIDKIKKAENELNRRMLHGEMYVSLNEFYDELDLDHTGIGDEIGWNLDNMLDIYFTSQIADDGTPCIVMEYRIAPKYNFNKL